MTNLLRAICLIVFASSPLTAAERGFFYTSSADCIAPCGIILGADLLYWTACQKSLLYRTTKKELDGKTTFEHHTAVYDWDTGFRLFGGIDLGYDNWQSRLVYTYWNNDQISGNLIESEDPPAGDHASGELNYQLLDLLLMNPITLFCDTTLWPFFGFRALWFDQEFGIDHFTQTASETITQTPLKAFDFCLFGAGVYGGLDWQWTFCEDFGAYLTFATSLLSGKSDNRYTAFTSSEKTVLKERDHQPIVGYHIAAGASWQTCFSACAEENWVRIALGYEFNQWHHIPQPIENIGVASKFCSSAGNLLIHGATLRFDYAF